MTNKIEIVSVLNYFEKNKGYIAVTYKRDGETFCETLNQDDLGRLLLNPEMMLKVKGWIN